MRARIAPKFITHPASLAAAFAAALMLSAPAAFAQTVEPKRTITVQGEGSVSAKPDTASVNAGVLAEAKTAREALTANTEKMTKVFEAIRKAGIKEEDIRTSGFSINAKYSHSPRKPDGTQEDPKIVGYRASNNVTVIIRDLDNVGGVLDELVTAGANNVNGVNFFIENPQSLMDDARRIAVEDALRRATILAGTAGANLGPVMTISENGGYRPQPMMMRSMAMEDAGAAVPVAAGTQEIRSNVNIVIELE